MRKKAVSLLLTALVVIAIMSVFVAPASAVATIETTKTTFAVGEAIVVTFAGSESTTDWIGICAESAPQYQNNALPENAWKYVNSDSQASGGSVVASGTVTFPGSMYPLPDGTASLPVGSYKMFFFTADSYDSVAVIHFTVGNPQTGDGGNVLLFSILAAAALLTLVISRKAIFGHR
jgi:hypothetical protein